MRQPTPEVINDYQPQPTDTLEPTSSPKIHNTSKATICTESDENITPDKGLSTKPIPEFTAIQLARFWSQVQIGRADECWLWTGPKSAAAYSSTVFYGHYLGFKVHRLAYHFLVGPIPEGLTVDHVKARGCINTLCCNRGHLEAISQTEQVRRRDGEKSITRVTLCKWGHVRPVGRKARCAECNARFVADAKRRKLEKDPIGERAKRAANRRRQRAAAKLKQQQELTHA